MSGSPWEWPGSLVTDVIDGDTFSALVTRDVGFGGTLTFNVRLRLNRCDAYKHDTVEGIAATTALTAMLPKGMPVRLVTVSPYKYGGPKTSPGEWMAEVWTTDGVNVTDAMVAAGHAVYWNGTGPGFGLGEGQ